MNRWVVLGAVLSGLGVAYAWAFRNLPGERWQVLAALPREKLPDGSWSGLNLTFYGVISATSCAAATAIFLLLAGMVGIPVWSAMAYAAMLVAAGLVASRAFNRLIAGNGSGFTVGGGAFAVIVMAPAVALLFSRAGTGLLPEHAGMMPLLAGLAVAYAFGEGSGRLACISFGCCYGKRADRAPAWLAPFVARWSFVFTGQTKKACYEGGAEGVPLVPVQGMAAVILTAAAAAGAALFMAGFCKAAFLAAFLPTQVWRVVSETIRDDERKTGNWRAYQAMAGFGALFGLVVVLVATPGSVVPDAGAGLRALLNPGVLLAIQAMWVVVFLMMGTSTVTGSRVDLFVRNRLVGPAPRTGWSGE
jgi:hypothetical protein